MRIVRFAMAIVVCVHGLSAVAAAPKDDATPKPAKIHLNSDSVEKLLTLEGITAAQAAAIVDKRCYEKVSDLLNKKVVATAVYDKIKDKVDTGDCVKPAPEEGAAKGESKADRAKDSGKRKKPES